MLPREGEVGVMVAVMVAVKVFLVAATTVVLVALIPENIVGTMSQILTHGHPLGSPHNTWLITLACRCHVVLPWGEVVSRVLLKPYQIQISRHLYPLEFRPLDHYL